MTTEWEKPQSGQRQTAVRRGINPQTIQILISELPQQGHDAIKESPNLNFSQPFRQNLTTHNAHKAPPKHAATRAIGPQEPLKFTAIKQKTAKGEKIAPANTKKSSNAD